MNRRNFLTKLGIGAAACAVVPKIVEENNDYDYEEVYDFSDEPRDGRIVKESIGFEGGMEYKDMGFIFPDNMQHREVTVDGVTWKISELRSFNPRV